MVYRVRVWLVILLPESEGHNRYRVSRLICVSDISAPLHSRNDLYLPQCDGQHLQKEMATGYFWPRNYAAFWMPISAVRMTKLCFARADRVLPTRDVQALVYLFSAKHFPRGGLSHICAGLAFELRYEAFEIAHADFARWFSLTTAVAHARD